MIRFWDPPGVYFNMAKIAKRDINFERFRDPFSKLCSKILKQILSHFWQQKWKLFRLKMCPFSPELISNGRCHLNNSRPVVTVCFEFFRTSENDGAGLVQSDLLCLYRKDDCNISFVIGKSGDQFLVQQSSATVNIYAYFCNDVNKWRTNLFLSIIFVLKWLENPKK